MAGIFVSYRREDTDGYAGRIADLLSQRFGPEKLFVDVDTILPGTGYPEVIQEKLDSCDVLLAVMGPKWSTAADSSGNKRLYNSADWVRREIETALQRQIPVVPVLVGNAKLPSADELPDELRPLLLQQAWAVTPQGFRDKVNALGLQLEQLVHDEAAKRATIERQRRIEETKAELEEYRSTTFPLRPYSYPLWVLFFCSAVLIAAATSVSVTPSYFMAAENISRADAALAQKEISEAIQLYQLTLNSFPSSSRAKIGMATSLFAQNANTNADSALTYLKGVDLFEEDWDRLVSVMPAQYKQRFSHIRTKHLDYYRENNP
jgi:hypothetical protein